MKRFIEKLFGRPLRTDEEDEEQIGPLSAVPVLGLDALASASYGPEAALTARLAVRIIFKRPAQHRAAGSCNELAALRSHGCCRRWLYGNARFDLFSPINPASWTMQLMKH
jgi:hypothetical protein